MIIQQFLKSFRGTDNPVPGIIEKPDGTIWLVNPDLTETQLPGGGALPDPSAEPDGDVLTTLGGVAVWSPGATIPAWQDVSDDLTVSNGDVDGTNSYAYALTQAAAEGSSFASLTALWLRVVYGNYTGGGEAGLLTLTLPGGTAAADENYKIATCEIAGFWATGGLGAWDTFGGSFWASADHTINVQGNPTFAEGEILICGMGLFPSF